MEEKHRRVEDHAWCHVLGSLLEDFDRDMNGVRVIV
jgi:hypothetical protein